MSGGVDEVKAAVYPAVHDVASVETALILQILLKLVVDVLNYCFKTEKLRMKILENHRDLHTL